MGEAPRARVRFAVSFITTPFCVCSERRELVREGAGWRKEKGGANGDVVDEGVRPRAKLDEERTGGVDDLEREGGLPAGVQRRRGEEREGVWRPSAEEGEEALGGCFGVEGGGEGGDDGEAVEAAVAGCKRGGALGEDVGYGGFCDAACGLVGSVRNRGVVWEKGEKETN